MLGTYPQCLVEVPSECFHLKYLCFPHVWQTVFEAGELALAQDERSSRSCEQRSEKESALRAECSLDLRSLRPRSCATSFNVVAELRAPAWTLVKNVCLDETVLREAAVQAA